MNKSVTRLTANARRSIAKIFGALALGALTLAPLASVSMPASAAPFGNARNDRDYRTLTGVVVNDVRGRDFVIRANSGERINVRSDEREPRRLSEGDEVRISGYFLRNRRDTFFATDVQILSNQRGNNRNGYTTYTGRVTDVDSNQNFDIEVNGTTYNVYAKERLPRRLNRGDYVRVYGVRSGDNDIRNATVAILDNRNNDEGSNSYRTYIGRVTNVDSDQRFDLNVNGTIYNVYSTTRLPRRLNRGDNVRVYGVRSGDNDIRNASVSFVANRR
jgi:membrane protein implicated in regulation of membrane protease activity